MFSKRRSFFSSLVVLALAAAPLPEYAQASGLEVYTLGGDDPVDFDRPPENPLPVLFVHGHNPLSGNDANRNYRNNWVTPLNGLTSFDMALGRNAHLGIEPYYLRLKDQKRSIEDDARAIEQVVGAILRRHGDPEARQVKVVIIALSKGTISSRLYLKRHFAERKISEFIAISPPNHGLSSIASSLPLMQLTNGYTPLRCCKLGTPLWRCARDRRSCAADAYRDCNFGDAKGCPSDFRGCDFSQSEGLHFVECLNGHSLCDTEGQAGARIEQEERFSSEAPGSRSNGEPVGEGVLYLVLGAKNNDDVIVGGDTLSDDCLGRKLAKNLAPDAVNRWLAVSKKGGLGRLAVHANAHHTPQVICLALYTAAHHRVPAETFRCELDSDQVPRIPVPAAPM